MASLFSPLTTGIASPANPAIKIQSPLARASNRPMSAYNRSNFASMATNVETLPGSVNTALPKEENITESLKPQDVFIAHLKTEESPSESKDRLPEATSVRDLKKHDLKRTTNPKFSRLMESAIDHFSFKKKQEGFDDTKANVVEERKSESSFDENNETLDQDEYIRKKREAVDLRKEIANRSKVLSEQQQIILKLRFDMNALKSRVRDPKQIRMKFNTEVEKLEKEIEAAKISTKRSMEMYIREKNDNEMAHRSFIFVLQRYFCK